jgi:DNA (cytosine-5)-methyltransferase 1
MYRGRPVLVDLCCGAGGASEGYRRAGWFVVGVDLKPQRHYPFPFAQMDALKALSILLARAPIRFLDPDSGEWIWLDLSQIDAFHASFPCQAYSVTAKSHGNEHPRLIEPGRPLLEATGKLYVMENVVGAPFLPERTIILCGSEFGLTARDDDGTYLELRRHRLFESSTSLIRNTGCRHDPAAIVGGVYGNGPSRRTDPENRAKRGGYTPPAHIRRALMGIDWMNRNELSESIPPAYTEFVGKQLLEAWRG